MAPESAAEPSKTPFPRSFWTANVTELFERGAYYAMASFVVDYLGLMGFGKYWPSIINSTLWGLVYFLPILSGTIADRIGFKKSLLAAFVLLAVGYLLMGYPTWFGGEALSETVGAEVIVSPATVIAVLAAVLMIGIGGSVIKPCISGTVQKTAGRIGRATLGFGIFYMVINIGSIFGRAASFVTRKELDLSFIFAVSVVFSIIAFFAVLLLYRDPEREFGDLEKKPRKSVLRILADMVLVLKSGRFAMFLLVSSGFFFIYGQVYNIVPMYLRQVVELKPNTDLITMANPITIVFFQLVITHLFGKWKPILSMVVGTIIIGLAWLVNLIPIFASSGVSSVFLGWMPVASVFAMLTVVLIAFGELFTSARTYEYIGALAPKGEEGLFLGYANLPMAIGAIVGGPVGALIFNDVMCKGAVKLPSGLLELDPFWNSLGWLILTGIGFASALAMWLYNRWLKAHPAKPSTAA